MKKLAILFLIPIIFLSSCAEENHTGSNNYFDLKTFMNAQILLLQDGNAQVEKKNAVNDEEEEYREADLDWKREFSLFLGSDIHNSSCTGKYKADTSRVDSTNEKVVRYIALEENLHTRLLELHFDSTNQITLVRVELYTKNFLGIITESLEYHALKYYAIVTEENSRWFGNDEYLMSGSIRMKSTK